MVFVFTKVKFSQMWTLQRKSESMHLRYWVWMAEAPPLLSDLKKKAELWGPVIPSSLSICASWSETICLGSFGPSAAQHVVPMYVGGN